MYIVESFILKNTLSSKRIFVMNKVSLIDIVKTYGIRHIIKMYKAKIISFKKSVIEKSIQQCYEQEQKYLDELINYEINKMKHFKNR